MTMMPIERRHGTMSFFLSKQLAVSINYVLLQVKSNTKYILHFYFNETNRNKKTWYDFQRDTPNYRPK